MRTIIPPQETVLRVLGPARKDGGEWRLCRYCHALPVPEGMLLHHGLTRELVLLTQAEWDVAQTLPALRERWFFVPEDTQDHAHADLVRWALRAMHRRGGVTQFTILPTTACNARCFYCFEEGRPRRMMTRETAVQAAEYIAAQCGGKPVRLNWFGGEPLLNPDAMDCICAALREAGISYTSGAVSNGYLFHPEMVKRAVDRWKLDAVQITLDGTEDIYNRTKAYVNSTGSGFRIVLQNIRCLLASGVHVTIRLNVSAENAQDMLQLAEILKRELQGRGSLYVYAHALFGADVSGAALRRLTEQLAALGLQRPKGLKRELPLNQCMADSGSARVILPDGRLTLCEHHTEDEIIGHVGSEQLDEERMRAWAEQDKNLAFCVQCAFYPECNRLKKCDTLEECSEETRRVLLWNKERSMQMEYRRFCAGETTQEHI